MKQEQGVFSVYIQLNSLETGKCFYSCGKPHPWPCHRRRRRKNTIGTEWSLRAGRVCTAQSHFYRGPKLSAFEKNQNLLLTYMDQVTQRWEKFWGHSLHPMSQATMWEQTERFKNNGYTRAKGATNTQKQNRGGRAGVGRTRRQGHGNQWELVLWWGVGWALLRARWEQRSVS